MVHCFHIDALGLRLCKLREDAVILRCDPVEGDRFAAVPFDGDQLGREVQAIVACEQFDAFFLTQHGEGGEEIVVPVGRSDAPDVRVTIDIDYEKGLQAVCEGVEEDGFAARGPDDACRIAVEVSGEVADILDIDLCALPVFRLSAEINVTYHQALLVGLIAVTGHRDPRQMLAVGAENRIGIISTVFLDGDGCAGQDVIDENARIGGEGVFLAGLFSAAIGDVTVVRRPVELLDAAERLCREFEQFFSQQVEGTVGCNDTIYQCGDISPWDFGHPVVPVPVHQVFRGISLCLVEGGIRVGRLDQCRVLDGRGIEDLLSVRGEFKLADAIRDIAQFHLFAKFRALQRRIP